MMCDFFIYFTLRRHRGIGMTNTMKVDHEFIMKILSVPGSASLGKTPRKTMTPRVSAPTPRVSSPPGSTPKDSSESKPVTLIYSYGNEKMLSYFNLLYTDMGFKNCQKFFHDETITTKGTLSENQFIHFMRRLTDLRDYQIVEMFDIFGTPYQ